MKLFKVLIVQILVVSALFPCSIFSLQDGDGIFLAGNEDFTKLNSSIRFVEASDDGFGYAVLGANGFIDSHPQIAINSHGLAVDWATVPTGQYKRDKKKKTLTVPLIPELMRKCRNLDEVREFINNHNIDHFAYEHLIVADSSGASFVIEWDGKKLNFIEAMDNYLLVTNFNLNDGDPMDCDRYLNGGYLLNTLKEDGFSKIIPVLDIMHQEGEYPTLYSYVFELTSKSIYIFNSYNFSQVSRIDLIPTLEKGNTEIDIRNLEYTDADKL